MTLNSHTPDENEAYIPYDPTSSNTRKAAVIFHEILNAETMPETPVEVVRSYDPNSEAVQQISEIFGHMLHDLSE